MNLLIKGGKMPICCCDCAFEDYEQGYCFASELCGHEFVVTSKGHDHNKSRHPDCPLVEIPNMPTQTLGDLFNAMGDAFKNFADNIKQKEGKCENNNQRFK